ncbi:MAG: type II toxin-antitoxin system RelE/ParE family toxin [Rhodopila sp.]|jgi:toxin ParE1/3/4
MTSARLAPSARRDLVEASRWIARDNPAAATALREGVAKVARILGEQPYIGNLRPAVADARYRFLGLTGLPYLVVYNPDRRPPLILRVLHTARDLPEVLRDL